ncbi:hypothetical protein LCGC14_0671440 [marine sediment metagenome]|uniref:Uncharacterized protein n=1 Tax=marine sediment metagenome TaxID=412755 RepID=A0A0F9QVW6_9ZZZZ
MGQSLAIPRVIPNDWKRLDLIINKIKFRLGRDSSPIFTGLTITGLTATRVLFAGTGGVISDDAGLTYVSATDILTAGTFNATDVDCILEASGTNVFRIGASVNNNIFVGEGVFSNDDGEKNVGFGFEAGANNTVAGAGTGQRNLYMGFQAGKGIVGSNANNCVALGYTALLLNDSGDDCVAIGAVSLQRNTGDSNTAIGRSTLAFNTTGKQNTAIGDVAGLLNVIGDFNTFIGKGAGQNSIASNNLFIGRFCGLRITSGASDLFLGTGAGQRQTTNSNILIIDNQDRSTAAAELTNSLIYGVFSATPASQSLRVNAGTFILGNPVHSDADDGGAVLLQGIREDGAGTPTVAGQIEISHDGSGANDQLGKIVVSVNTGSGLVQALEIGSDLLATFAGKLIAGAFASPLDVTNTREYGVELHYSGNNYDVTGIRSRAQLVTTDTSASAQGALLQAANNDGINAGVLNGALIEAIGKSTANAATITTMRGALVGAEWGAFDTVTNLKTLHVRTHSLNSSSAGSFDTGYGIYIENEAVGGNGQALDAGIYFKGTSLSAGNKAFTYGVDFSGATYGSADIKLSDDSVINDANNRWGIGTSNPATKVEISHAGFVKLRVTNTDNSVSGELVAGFGASAGFWLQSQSNHPLYFSTNSGNAKMTLAIDGNFGIGTIIPTAALQMGNDKLIAVDVNAGLTASTTQEQGQGALTAQVNEISTVANDGDTITLPAAVTGIEIEIINNGANTLKIFPASGDDLGLGTGATTSFEELEANERVKFVAYDTTNWAKESTTEIIHAEIHDEDNTNAFVINDAGGDFHSFHTNGLVAGDLADWTFDAGGAGTSHAITGIVQAGSDITVTTGDAHGLAVGDIISQTNLADAAYVGVFEVLTVPLTTTYTVTASYTATGTGTMDQAATLEANAVAAGVYSFAYYMSGTPVSPNETFDFQLYKGATAVTGSKVRRKFGAGGDFGSTAGGGVVSVASGEKISFALSNEDSAANLIIRNLTIVLIRL